MVNMWIVTQSFSINFHIHLFRRASSSVHPRASYISHLSSESVWCWYWSHSNNHILLSFLTAVQYTTSLMSGGILQYKHNWWCTKSDYDIPYTNIRMFNNVSVLYTFLFWDTHLGLFPLRIWQLCKVTLAWHFITNTFMICSLPKKGRSMNMQSPSCLLCVSVYPHLNFLPSASACARNMKFCIKIN